MLYTFLFIIGIIFTLLFVVGTHEYAHFIAARFAGVKVLRFSIGFGKPLFQWHDKRGTQYIFALIPLGGYVKMLDEREENVPPALLPFTYNQQPFYRKFYIVLAGPLINILCALFIYWFIYMVGFQTIRPVIGTVTAQSIASQAGLKPYQEIMSIDNKKIINWTSVLFNLILHLGDQDEIIMTTRPIPKNCLSGAQVAASCYNTSSVTTIHRLSTQHWQLNELNPDPLSSLGILPFGANEMTRNWQPSPILLRTIKMNAIDAFIAAKDNVLIFTKINLILFAKMITGKLSLHSLGGPLTIFGTAGQALNNGILPFMSFLAFISLSLGIVNLIPIPGLDGGHLLFQTVEWIIRRPVPETVLIFSYRLGFFFLIFILLQALGNDLLRLL